MRSCSERYDESCIGKTITTDDKIFSHSEYTVCGIVSSSYYLNIDALEIQSLETEQSAHMPIFLMTVLKRIYTVRFFSLLKTKHILCRRNMMN